MCGRFTREFTWKQVHDFLDLNWPSELELTPAYNVAPTQTIPVCRSTPDHPRELVLMHWGFLPAWARDDSHPVINARAETVASSGMFRAAFKSRRCLVPASGFYEWKKPQEPVRPEARTPGRKTPMYIRLINDPILCFAGIYETWDPRTPETQPLTTTAILTTTPNELMSGIHDRMPVILHPKDFDRWLTASDDEVKDLLRPFPADQMEAFPVGTSVNSPRNDGPELIAPAPSDDAPHLNAAPPAHSARAKPRKPPEPGLFGD